MACQFEKQAKCEKCTYITYNDCKKFRYWRAKYFLKDLLPLTYRKLNPLPKGRCYWTTSEDYAIQRIASTALKNQKPVRKLKLSQVMSIVLDKEEFEASIVYIECKRTAGDVAKITNVVQTFVDKLLLHGVTICLFNQNSWIKADSDWVKISEGSHD